MPHPRHHSPPNCPPSITLSVETTNCWYCAPASGHKRLSLETFECQARSDLFGGVHECGSGEASSGGGKQVQSGDVSSVHTGDFTSHQWSPVEKIHFDLSAAITQNSPKQSQIGGILSVCRYGSTDRNRATPGSISTYTSSPFKLNCPWFQSGPLDYAEAVGEEGRGCATS